jgi:2-keto-4-pentenoate hydratase/2-oxohepta-3-ene-1,7-dioic acid hydratase in catechol pathway
LYGNVCLQQLIFNIGQAISYASQGETLYPGELIGTGTIPTCCGIENGHFLKPGDHIRLEIERVGYVENTITQYKS